VSAGTIETEITELAGLDLESAPPCQMRWTHQVTHRSFCCGKPSVIRLHIRCKRCGFSAYRFYCRECWEDIRKGDARCGSESCDSSEFTYRES
jgi:hypothetical protein